MLRIRRRRTHAETHATERVLLPPLLLQFHHETRAAGKLDRLFESERRRAVHVHLLVVQIHAPAGFGFSINRIAYRKARLIRARLCAHNFHRLRFVRCRLRSRQHADLGQHKVPALRTARRFVWKGRIGEGFEFQFTDLRALALDDDGGRFFLRAVGQKERRIVIEQFRLRAARRLHAERTQRCPLFRIERIFLRQLRELLRRVLDIQFRRFHCLGGGEIQIEFVRIIHERHHLKILTMRDRIVFVRVALRAAEREAEPRRARRRHAVGHGVEAKLQRVNSAFFVQHRVAVKAGRHLLLARRPRQQVARDLLDGELIKRHVRVQRIDHPVAPRPDAALAVLFVAVRVCVTREVEPPARPALAVLRRGEQLVR